MKVKYQAGRTTKRIKATTHTQKMTKINDRKDEETFALIFFLVFISWYFFFLFWMRHNQLRSSWACLAHFSYANHYENRKMHGSNTCHLYDRKEKRDQDKRTPKIIAITTKEKPQQQRAHEHQLSVGLLGAERMIVARFVPTQKKNAHILRWD